MSEVVLKEGTEPPTPDPGYITIFADSATGNLRYKKDTGAVGDFVGQSDPEFKTLIVEIPSNSENISFFFTDVAITVSKINVVLTGTTPSLTWALNHSQNRNDQTPNQVYSTTTTSEDTGDTITSGFGDATIPANSHVWFTTSGKSGVVNSVSITVQFNED